MYSGDSAATLNTLTHVVNPDTSKTLANLVADAASSTEFSTLNQTVFMNQPMSWWLTNLNSGAVKYMPVSNNVNWGFKNASGAVFYIGRPISDLLLPNRVESMSVDKNTGVATILYQVKLGMSRIDTREDSMMPSVGGATGSTGPAL
jgi:hypothetical protein